MEKKALAVIRELSKPVTYRSPVTIQGIFLRLALLVGLLWIQFLTAPKANAVDRYTFLNSDGEKERVVARLVGKGKGFQALEEPSGRIRVVQDGARPSSSDSEEFRPLDHKEVAAELETKYGKDLFRFQIEEPFLIGLVLMAPIDKRAEKQVVGSLRKVGRFLKTVESLFLKFTRSYRITTKPPEFPMVVLIFESDDDFIVHARKVTGSKGLSAENLAGFYDPLSNYLSIRMTECTTFDVPLHEAIHQLVYNRQIFKRLAHIPVWFNEGIATGFEANGGRVQSGPSKIHWRYASRVNRNNQVSLETIVQKDDSFRGDVLAGAAYSEGWGLHWLLANRHKADYMKYVQLLTEKKHLEEYPEEQRLKEFQSIFETSFDELRDEMQTHLKIASKHRKPGDDGSQPRGKLHSFIGLGEVEFSLITRMSAQPTVQMKGRIRNLSPFRALDFVVTAKNGNTEVGSWSIPNLGRQKVALLPLQYFPLPGNTTPQSVRLFINVKSTLPEKRKTQ